MLLQVTHYWVIFLLLLVVVVRVGFDEWLAALGEQSTKGEWESVYRRPPAAHGLTVHGFIYMQVGYLGHPLLNANEDLHCCVTVWTPSGSCTY